MFLTLTESGMVRGSLSSSCLYCPPFIYRNQLFFQRILKSYKRCLQAMEGACHGVAIGLKALKVMDRHQSKFLICVQVGYIVMQAWTSDRG